MEVDTRTDHPNPQPQPHHRKIELQSPLDLTYLQENLAKTALSKLDLHFPSIPAQPKPATIISLDGSSQTPQPTTSTTNNPSEPLPSENEPDPLRTKVHSLLSDFLTQTWSNAQSNLTLNNLDATTHPIPSSATLTPATSSSTPLLPSTTTTKPVPEIEGLTFTYTPFNPHLQTKLSTLHAELDRLTNEVSQLRRSAPRQGATQYQSSLSSTLSSEENTHQNAQAQIQSENHDDILEIDKLRKGWNQDVREVYTSGTEGLKTLAGMNTDGEGEGSRERKRPREEASLTETVGKVQRARRVVLEME